MGTNGTYVRCGFIIQGCIVTSIRKGWGYIPEVVTLEEVHHFLQVVPLELHFLPFHKISLHSNVE